MFEDINFIDIAVLDIKIRKIHQDFRNNTWRKSTKGGFICILGFTR